MKENIRKIILVISACVFLFSVGKLVLIYLEYKEIDDNAEAIRELATVEVENETDDQESFYMVDWDALIEVNSDVVGWIQIPDTNIDYPILLGETNDTYIRTDINMNYSTAGCIFMEMSNAGDFSDDNTILYGHNMANDSMFGDLQEYVQDSSFYEDHSLVYIYTPDGLVSSYRIVSVHYIDATSSLYATTINDEAGYRSLMTNSNKISSVLSDYDLDNVLMLSTCAPSSMGETTRVVVHAVLEQEGIDPLVDVTEE
ncbi:class B sortase [Tannockella kyphosi]|uniref:class B sortase n=1 Tax=Tannockella kyphosi TaxID=2899121 RepID=UPI0020122039|nr:class B sortase [Tannockella kyphosi]